MGDRCVLGATRDLTEAGLLSRGTQLVLVANGRRDVAHATLTDAGEILWQGRAYRSPSDMAFAPLLGVTKFNGWAYWHVELPTGRASLADVRAKLLSSAADSESQEEMRAN